MSDFIQTRTSVQCRSHHQKMLKKYGTIKKIIHVLSKKYPPLTSKPLNEVNFIHQRVTRSRKEVQVMKEHLIEQENYKIFKKKGNLPEDKERLKRGELG